MLFLNFENQLFLLLVLTFSFLLFMGSLAIKFQPIKTRVFGMAFIIPLIHTSVSFLTATYNSADASSLLIVSHILFLLNGSFIMLLKSGSDVLKVFHITPFFLLGIGFFVFTQAVYSRLFWIICFLVLSIIVINLVLLINTMFHKDKSQASGFAGLFIIASAIGLWLISGFLNAEALFLLALGYICCTIYLYKNSLQMIFKEYQQNSNALKKMSSSLHSEVIRRVEEIERSNRKLLEKSKTDSMTGLLVKSAVIEKLNNFIERSPKSTISVLMFDIDLFKQINDTMGHQTGDVSIRNLTNLIKTSFRQDDIPGRYGGDEFIVLLPDTPPIKAFIIADRFRELIQNKTNPPITISMGISSYPADGKTPAALIDAADKALYISKQKGRNCVTLYSSQFE